MFVHVPTAAFVTLSISLLICIVLPIGLLIYWRKKTKADLAPCFIGAGVFVLGVLVIESLFNSLIFLITGSTISGNLLVFALYGGFAAGLFEEGGRLLAMSVFFKKKLNKNTAIMYGIGHGGAEAIFLVGMSCLNSLITGIMMNTGFLEASLKMVPEKMIGDTVNQLNAAFAADPTTFLTMGVERISAVVMQICLSYLVYIAVKDKKFEFWGLALFLHFLIDFLTVIISRSLPSIWITEVVVFVLAAIFAYFVYKDFTKRPMDENVTVKETANEEA